MEARIEYLEAERDRCLFMIDEIQRSWIIAYKKECKLNILKEKCSMLSEWILELKDKKDCACRRNTKAR